jgi:hypothetical protein
MREHLGRIAAHATAPAAPPARDVDRFWYGVAQPLLGLRTLWRTPALRRRALGPVLAVLVVAGLVAVGEEGVTPDRVLWRFTAAVAGLASMPAVLFANTYARLAADATAGFGFGTPAPLLSSLVGRLGQMLRSAVLIALGVAPLVAVVRVAPLVGDLAVLAVSAAWTLHWIVVEALDGARVAAPPEPAPPAPWFVAWTSSTAWDHVPVVCRLVRWFGRVITRLARPWLEEVALVARHPALALGFGAATAALLAVPVANLLLRPAILVGAVHLRGQLAARR